MHSIGVLGLSHCFYILRLAEPALPAACLCSHGDWGAYVYRMIMIPINCNMIELSIRNRTHEL